MTAREDNISRSLSTCCDEGSKDLVQRQIIEDVAHVLPPADMVPDLVLLSEVISNYDNTFKAGSVDHTGVTGGGGGLKVLYYSSVDKN